MPDMMSKELDKLLGIQRRSIVLEKHETGRLSVINMASEISLLSRIDKKVVATILNAFLIVLRRHLIDHKRIRFTNIGTFYFVKSKPRKASKNFRNESIEYYVPPRCRLKFLTMKKFMRTAGWYPEDELAEALDQEERRKARVFETINRLKRERDENARKENKKD